MKKRASFFSRQISKPSNLYLMTDLTSKSISPTARRWRPPRRWLTSTRTSGPEAETGQRGIAKILLSSWRCTQEPRLKRKEEEIDLNTSARDKV